jgi:hypothetical protein
MERKCKCGNIAIAALFNHSDGVLSLHTIGCCTMAMQENKKYSWHCSKCLKKDLMLNKLDGLELHITSGCTDYLGIKNIVKEIDYNGS